ncbi:MAG: carboxypeptidase-like regulatory domain-containing protein [Planctomycetaceae bacterium]
MVRVLRRSFGVQFIFLFSAAVLLAGCSSGEPPTPSGMVHGSVTLNGKPYTNAAVTMISLQTGQAGSANIQDDGTYRILTPLWVGMYQVFLSPKLEDNLETAEPKPVYMDETVPEKYWNETTTDLICTIKEGDNEFVVELKK